MPIFGTKHICKNAWHVLLTLLLIKNFSTEDALSIVLPKDFLPSQPNPVYSLRCDTRLGRHFFSIVKSYHHRQLHKLRGISANRGPIKRFVQPSSIQMKIGCKANNQNQSWPCALLWQCASMRISISTIFYYFLSWS